MGNIAHARLHVAGVLTEALAGEGSPWAVLDHGARLDRVDTPTAMVVLDRVEARPELGHGVAPRRVLSVWVLEPLTTPGDADDALDASLAEVLGALDVAPDLLWTDAVRDVYLDAVPAYRVTVNLED